MAQGLKNVIAGGKTNQLTDDQLRSFIRIEIEHREVCKKANDARKAARKQFQAAGALLGVMDEMIASLDQPRSEVQERFATRERYARMLKLPVGTQADMFTENGGIREQKDEDTGDIAFAKGFQSGVVGASATVPEDYLPENQKWLEGYNAGQSSLAVKVFSTGATDNTAAAADATAAAAPAEEKSAGEE